MEAGTVPLLLLALMGTASALSFYGDSISFMPPQRNEDGTLRVTFNHRQNGRKSCQGRATLTCGPGDCSGLNTSEVQQTEKDNMNQGRWCQSEGRVTAVVPANRTSLSLRGSGCCWVSNVTRNRNWTSHAEVDLGTRSDLGAFNRCPVTTTVPSLRITQNCFSVIRLLAHDPDGDDVKCRSCSDAPFPLNFTLDQDACTLTGKGEVDVGVHVFELMLEDFPTKNITLNYDDGAVVFWPPSDPSSSPLCKVKLQFMVEILPPIPSCKAGHMRPVFLTRTPSHGDVLHATVGQIFQLEAQAQAHHASIADFQVSGPVNMSKTFKAEANGKASVTLNWMAQQSDLQRLVPVCFTAETDKIQSEMRCVVIMVTEASINRGKATVECSADKMTVVLSRASMPGIDEKHLTLTDPTCSLTANNTHIMGSMSFSTCGTKLVDRGDFMAYENEINSFELPTEVITRRRTVKIGFSCQFPKALTVSSHHVFHKSDYIFTESSFGSFGYTFEIYHDGNFTRKVEASAYPVEVKLLQTIFMGVQAESQLPNVKLFVESCKATPDNNPENSLSYELIKNGCLEDETIKVYPSNQTSYNFEVQAFKFTGNYNQVYITCSVILCEASSPFSRCAQGCVKNPPSRRRRMLSRETARHYISQGPLRFVGQDVPSAAVNDDSEMKKSDKLPAAPGSPDPGSSTGSWGVQQLLGTKVSTAVFACAFLVSLVFLAVVVRHFSKRRKEEALIVAGWET